MPDQKVDQEKPRFTYEEKCKYFAARVNNVNISAGQRRYAEQRLNELLGTDMFDSTKKSTTPSVPAYMQAKQQFDETLMYHERRQGDPYSRGYARGASNYEMYWLSAKAKGGPEEDVKEVVREYRKNVNIEHAQMRKLANHALYSKQEDPNNLKNMDILEARGYMKALSDAAKARKGIPLK